MTSLAARNLSVAAGGKTLVRDVTLDLEPGTLVGLVGPNGAGKSTLMRALCGLAPLSAGSVSVDGVGLDRLGREALAKRLAFLPQRHMIHWDLSAEEVIALGRLPYLSSISRPGAADRAAIERAIARADVTAFRGRAIASLSGGERARVMLARALAVEAPILLADEPIAALDPFHALQIMELLRTLASEGRTLLVVLHDLSHAMRFCDRLLLMDGGRLVGDGAPADVLRPEAVGSAYRVAGLYGTWRQQPYFLPWDRLAAPASPSLEKEPPDGLRPGRI